MRNSFFEKNDGIFAFLEKLAGKTNENTLLRRTCRQTGGMNKKSVGICYCTGYPQKRVIIHGIIRKPEKG